MREVFDLDAVDFFVVAFFLADADFDDFAFTDFDDFDFAGFFALTIRADEQLTRARLLRAVRPFVAFVQRTGLGFVHPA